MELSIEEGEIPIPINTNINIYGGCGGHGNGNGNGHNTIPLPTSNGQEDHHHVHGSGGPFNNKQQKVVRYRECLKNHAAAMGGNATDGCGEFMPSGEDGTIEAFNCSACNCHRNFHRKEVEGDPSPPHELFNFSRRKFLLGPSHHHKNNNILPSEALGYPTPTRTVPPHHMIMPYNIGGPLLAASESDEQEEGGVGRPVVAAAQLLVKKRHRTKFSQEQKEKMLSFAEKVGWKIQKHEESVVQQFCQEIGVKRRVLKVWMHNNKHNLAKKMNHLPPPPPPP
ncbi:hypothetical protein Lal_00049968 [Lupinus albus]|uniref:Putative transcription factor ZF-HD family n=1 Tax=Lupinus albus TaxID=3870 RepID=A0A6A5M3J8_LUPAL|nr:putative transcription factor ZF-HD family [Lupinus albus]KAF1867539.1 hypothetical protein Lal_00049968 [Lupinus albus]